MIDYSNEIFNALAVDLRLAFEGIFVKGEYVNIPAKFPCVTIDEIRNIPDHLDGARENKYARVTYRVQVFSNAESGKRSEARKIYDRIDRKMMGLGFFCKTYSTIPEIYNSEIYSITATYEGVIDRNGVIYRN